MNLRHIGLTLVYACISHSSYALGGSQAAPPLWHTQAGTLSAQLNASGLLLTARTPSGKIRWTHLTSGTTHYATKLLDGNLAVIVSLSGSVSSNITVVIDPNLTEALDVQGAPTRVRATDHLALFGPLLLSAPTDGEPIPFQVLHTRSPLKLDTVKFMVPSRPQCGDPTGVNEAGAEALTNHYYYATRTDQCGKFTTRFDWVNPSAPLIVYPARP